MRAGSLYPLPNPALWHAFIALALVVNFSRLVMNLNHGRIQQYAWESGWQNASEVFCRVWRRLE
ncbi:hypothetical protein [Brenneria roseae]|uniref:hypothetical protein n=1 Tax=Brenneria roseae TaxID=1509241 RepID=UPI0011B274C4|nr:hypothetical protein [Brenneria roseae]